MTITLVIAGIVGLMALWVYFDTARHKKKAEGVFAGRAPLTSEEFYEAHFKSADASYEVVKGIREILQKQTGEDFSRVLPNDDFSQNLNFMLADMMDVAIVEALEEKFGIKISDDEAGQAKTIADIVFLVEKKRRLPIAR